MRGLPAILFLGLTWVGHVWAGDAPFPELATADAWLRVEDARWVERETARFTAALSRDSRPITSFLSTLLYRSSNLDGIDLSRPALLWWRGGPAPFAALIPTGNRQAFLDAFGFLRDGDGPLVRVGDRDGTVIYTQSYDGGTREYRVLITDEVAIVGRNLDECRRLAQRASTMLTINDRVAAPVSFTLNAKALAGLDPSVVSWPAKLPIGGWLDPQPLLRVAATWVLPQLESIQVEIRPETGGMARITSRIKAKPDSDLAAWMNLQTNSGSRLLTQVQPDLAAMVLCSHLTWRGRLESQAKDLQAALGDTIPASAGPAWIECVQLMERAGDLVWSLQIPSPGTRISVLAIDQPRADEQARAFDTWAGTVLDTPSMPRAGLGQFRSGKLINQVIATTSRQLLIVDGMSMSGGRPASDPIQEVTSRLLNRLQQVTAPSGEQAIFSLRVDLSRLTLLAHGADFETVPPAAPINLVVKTSGPAQLTAEMTIPLALAAQALGHLPEDRRGYLNR